MKEPKTTRPLTGRQRDVLACLDDGAWRTSRAIADSLGARSKASLVGTLRRLVQMGYVESEAAGTGPYHEHRYRRTDVDHPQEAARG